MRTGIFTSSELAERVARAEVMTARDRINGMTGDPATKAQEKLKAETKGLADEMRAMRQNGVPLRLVD